MSIPDERAAQLRQKYSVSLVFVLSLVAVVWAVVRIITISTELTNDLAHRLTGISYTWTPQAPLREPAHFHTGTAAAVTPGSTSTISQMTGTVKNLPVSTLVLQSAGELTTVLTTVGIAVCLLLVARSIGSGSPFAKTCSRAFIGLAVIVAVGYEGAGILHLISEATRPLILFDEPAFTGTFISDGETIGLPFWPLYVATALVALAAVFRTGSGYRDDAAGVI